MWKCMTWTGQHQLTLQRCVLFVRATVRVKRFHLVGVNSIQGGIFHFGWILTFLWSPSVLVLVLVQPQHSNILWQKAQIHAVEYNSRKVLLGCNYVLHSFTWVFVLYLSITTIYHFIVLLHYISENWLEHFFIWQL